jgi:hypothetical protein
MKNLQVEIRSTIQSPFRAEENKMTTMRFGFGKMFTAFVLSALMVSAAAAQDAKSTTPASLAQSGSAATAGSPTNFKPMGVPTSCTGTGACQWYSGDFDSANPAANGLWNGYNTPAGAEAQVWVPFIATPNVVTADLHVRLSAVTFNELTNTVNGTTPPPDFSGMTYTIRTDVGNGLPGNIFKMGKCTINKKNRPLVLVPTGNTGFGLYEWSYTCYLNVVVKEGVIYWVNLLPIFNQSSVAYLSDVEDLDTYNTTLNQFGWSDDLYNSFITSNSFFGYTLPTPTWTPTNLSFTGACGGLGCDEFSVAVAGTYIP